MSPRKQLNNKGYTLIELIVTILMTAIVAAILSLFISVSRTSYDEIRKEAVLQEEAQMAGSYIGDIAIETITKCEFKPFGSNKVLTIKAPDPEYLSGTLEYYYFIILWETSTQTLRFCKVKDIGTPPDYATVLPTIIGNPRALLARYVTDMQVVTSDKLTKITLTMKYRDEEYVLTKNITGRNLN